MKETQFILISLVLLTASFIPIDGASMLQADSRPMITRIEAPSVERTWNDVDLLYPSVFHDTAKLNEEIRNILPKAPGITDLEVIGKSFQGKNISVVTITNEMDDRQKAKTLVVAHHHGREQITVELALRFILMLINGYGVNSEITEYVNTQEIFIIPTLNPDALDIVVNEGNYWLRKNLRLYDNDEDGLFDEDPVEDVDGDGIISGYDVYSKYDGHRAYIESYYEGIDNDGDGEVNEDEQGLVDLNRNYPTFFGDQSSSSDNPKSEVYHGTAPFSEPETSAFRDFVLHHRFAMVYSLHSGINATFFPTNTRGHWQLPRLYSDIIEDFSSILPESFNQNNNQASELSHSLEMGLAGGWGEWMYTERGTLVPITFEVYRNASSMSPELTEIVHENSTHIIERWDGIYPFFTPVAGHINALWVELGPAFEYLLEMTPRLDAQFNSISETADGISVSMTVGTHSPRLGSVESVKMTGKSNEILKTWFPIDGETSESSQVSIPLSQDWAVSNYSLTIGNNYTGIEIYLLYMQEFTGIPLPVVIGVTAVVFAAMPIAWYLLKAKRK
jgi:hypothetical protein